MDVAKMRLCVLVATSRNARSHRKMIVTLTPTQRLAAHLQQKNPSDTILSWNTWLDRLWESLCILEPYLPGRLSDWQALQIWRGIIKSDSAHLLNINATTALAAEAWQHLQRWDLSLDYCPLPSQDALQFLQWADRYSKRLRTDKYVDSATFIGILIQKVTILKPLLPQKIQCMGFDDWPPQWQRWIDTLIAQGIEVCYPDADILQNQSCIAYRLTDTQTEWKAAALWVQELLEKGVTAPIAVVIPNLATVRADILHLFNSILNPWPAFRVGEKQPKCFNISGGEPLAHMPVIESALFFLKEGLKEEMVSPHNPYFSQSPGLYRLDRGADRKLPSDWIADILQRLHAAGWPGERVLHSDAYQAVLAWHQVLKTLKTEAQFLGVMSYTAFYQALSEQCVQTLFQSQSIHEQSNVHVLGILEAAGLAFDYAWVSGLYEGQWPGAPKPNPFLDFTIQRQKNMPHASFERETDFAQKILKRLVTQTRHIVLSTPEYVELKLVLESQLIFEHTLEVQSYPLSLLAEGRSLVGLLQSVSGFDWYIDPIGLPWAGEAVRGGISLLKSQAACPYQNYVTVRLGAKAPEKNVYGLSPQERGQWLHKALELFWSQQATQKNLLQLSSAELDDALQAVIIASRPLSPKGPHFWQLESQRLLQLLQRVCEWEKSREPFTVLATEQPQLLSVDSLHFKGRLDRLDQVGQNDFWLIDYKTGPQNVSDWLGERLLEPQLPLYVLHSPHPVTRMMALEIHPKKIRAHYLDAPLDDLKKHWQESLNTLASNFIQGKAMVSPVHPTLTCRYCHYQSLCRRIEGVDQHG